jgi:ribosome-dependent ATPase
MHTSVGAFTKGLGPNLLVRDLIILACCIPVLWAVSTLALNKQEK